MAHAPWPAGTASVPVVVPGCGARDSCCDLARGGPGSIDVIEIGAASHGGVDDARGLHEKAFFAPVKIDRLVVRPQGGIIQNE